MPYMHWETDRRRETLARLTGIESERHRIKLEGEVHAERKRRQGERVNLECIKRHIIHPEEDPVFKSKRLPSHSDVKPKLPKYGEDGTLNPAPPLQNVRDVVVRKWRQFRKKSSLNTLDIDDNGRLEVETPLGQYLIDAARLYEYVVLPRRAQGG
jgi:hypothetical protein